MWRSNIENFEAKCKKIKTDQSSRQDSDIEEEVNANPMEEFNQITPVGGRQLLKDSGVLILSEWDIANAMTFYAIRKEKDTKFRTEEEVMQAHKGVKYSDYHKALVMWSIQKRDKAKIQEVSDSEHIGSLMVCRVEEVDSEKVALINKEVADFRVVVAAKAKNKFLESSEKFEKVLEAYEERGRTIY